MPEIQHWIEEVAARQRIADTRRDELAEAEVASAEAEKGLRRARSALAAAVNVAVKDAAK